MAVAMSAYCRLLLVVGAVMGCSRGEHFDRKPTVKVIGTLFVGGEPAKGAMLTFVRANGVDPDYPGAQGIVADDGSYELTTYTTKDGVIAGEYVVNVIWPTRPDWWNAEEDLSTIDRLKGEYGPGKSTIRCSVAEGQERLDPIELN